MPLNIPMPKSIADYFSEGFDTGLNMYQRAQQNKLQRDQMKAAEDHFQQELALRKAAAARAGANSDLQRRMMEEQLLGLKQSHDPLFKAHQYEALENYWKNRGNPQMQNAPAPSQEMGQGMGMFSPEGMAQAQQQQAASQGNPAGGIDIEAMKQSPMLRAAFKDTFKFDPLAAVPQTPQEKQGAALDLFKQKEAIKLQNKGGASGDLLTNPIKTKYQSVIGGATSALPIIDHLIEETRKGNVPGQMIGSLFKRDAQANYKGEISTLLDGIRNAYTIPNTDSGTEKAEDKVLRKSGESDDNYIKRLSMIRQQIVDREADARAKLGTGNITTSVTPSKVTETKVINGKTYKKINGEWHE